MYKSIVACVCLLACLMVANKVKAQTNPHVFYNNTTDAGFYYNAGAEIAMPIAFSGSNEVTSFTFGYYLPPGTDASGDNTTNAIVNFYTASPAGDAYGAGPDPTFGGFPNLVSSTEIDGLGSGFHTVNQDLTLNGNMFEWDAAPLLTGETGGYMSVQFINGDGTPDVNAGWELATGDSNDDFYQDMTNGGLYDFGGVNNGNPQAAFDASVSGYSLNTPVPEMGTALSFGGLLIPACLIYLRRRNEHRSTGLVN